MHLGCCRGSTEAHLSLPLLLLHVGTNDTAGVTWKVQNVTTGLWRKWLRAWGPRWCSPQSYWWGEWAWGGLDRSCALTIHCTAVVGSRDSVSMAMGPLWGSPDVWKRGDPRRWTGKSTFVNRLANLVRGPLNQIWKGSEWFHSKWGC